MGLSTGGKTYDVVYFWSNPVQENNGVAAMVGLWIGLGINYSFAWADTYLPSAVNLASEISLSWVV